VIVDARSRVPHPDLACLSSLEATQRVNRQFGFTTPPSFEQGSMARWHEEQDEAGIDVALVVGRTSASCRVPNDVLAQLQQDGQGRIVAVAGLDVAGAVHDPLAELARCAADLGVLAVAIDPGTALGQRPDVHGLALDDPRVVEVCRAAGELGVPVVCLTGPYAGPDLTQPDVGQLDRLLVACRQPDPARQVQLVASHACYPDVLGAIACAAKHANLSLCPDLYVTAPGGAHYLEAAQGILADQVLFGSAYPYSHPGELLARLAPDALTPEARAAYLGGNAQRLFGRALAHVGATGRSAP
jgi:predicted TIM-barrel fold metal-dependent hydrolase